MRDAPASGFAWRRDRAGAHDQGMHRNLVEKEEAGEVPREHFDQQMSGDEVSDLQSGAAAWTSLGNWLL